MAFSIELHFDEKSNSIIRSMWKKLSEANISDYMDQHGGFPHISVVIFDDIDILGVEKLIEEVAEKESIFTLKMCSLGIFPSNQNVLFLSPVASETLINLHVKLHFATKNIESKWEYYLPNQWVPHCTLGMNIPLTKINHAIEVINEDYQPLEVRIETIQLVEFNPPKIVKSFKLKV